MLALLRAWQLGPQTGSAAKMTVLLLNMALTLAGMAIILAVWMGVHLAARRRMGERAFSCKGPSVDAQGVAWCCKGDGSLCEDARGK